MNGNMSRSNCGGLGREGCSEERLCQLKGTKMGAVAVLDCD